MVENQDVLRKIAEVKSMTKLPQEAIDSYGRLMKDKNIPEEEALNDVMTRVLMEHSKLEPSKREGYLRRFVTCFTSVAETIKPSGTIFNHAQEGGITQQTDH